MASPAHKSVVKIQSHWLARDLTSWRVRVPCQGGSGRFYFKEYGGSEKALKAARAFQRKALKLLAGDREYAAKHGETPHRETLPITNKSGILGVYRVVVPLLGGNPIISWCASWTGPNGKRFVKCYSTVSCKTEAEAKRKAIQKRKEMVAHILLPTN